LIKENNSFYFLDWYRIIKLDLDLNQSSIVINDTPVWSIHFESSNNNLYITSWDSLSIYHTNDEINFIKIHTISTSYHIYSITINNDKIYTGTNDSTILVFNKTNNSLIQVMNNMCSSSIWSVKFDCNDNMIYSCFYPPMVKIIGTNGINTTIPLNDIFMLASGLYIDSKNRLWIGGHNGSVVYT
jgi:ligand-binding sensor domain-containing protein